MLGSGSYRGPDESSVKGDAGVSWGKACVLAAAFTLTFLAGFFFIFQVNASFLHFTYVSCIVVAITKIMLAMMLKTVRADIDHPRLKSTSGLPK